MKRVLIVDDEPKAVTGLTSILELFASEYKVIGSANSVEEAIPIIQKTEFDVLFLDISMGQSDGFDLLDSLGPDREFDTIFVTAHAEYAIKAIRNGAFDYLLKPVDPELLVAALQRLDDTKLRARSDANKEEFLPKISLPGADKHRVIDVMQIEYIEADGSYSVLVMCSGEKHTISRRLASFEAVLDMKVFLRLHKSYLVNSARIHSILKSDGGSVVMASERQIPIGRSKKVEVFDFLNSMFGHL